MGNVLNQESECDAITALARYLYETMERLAPGDGDFIEWQSLLGWQRDFYCMTVEKLFDERDLIGRVWQFTNHDMVLGRAEERK